MKKFFSLLLFVVFLYANEANIAKLKVSNKNFLISGAFINYGKGSFDWIYVTMDASFVGKLNGLDTNTSYFDWTVVHTEEKRAFLNIDFYKDKVVFGGLNPDINSSFVDIFSDTIQDIDGYFIKYDNGAFDWLFITPMRDLVAKLNGIDAQTNTFVWEILHSTQKSGFTYIGIDEIDRRVYFGAGENFENITQKECNAYGGIWKVGLNLCYVKSENTGYSNSSYSPYIINEDAAWCESIGGEYQDDLCLYNGSFCTQNEDGSKTCIPIS